MPAVALAVESVAALAVRRRITESLHSQHAAEDEALLRTARALADGSAHLMPRTPSMLREAEVCAPLRGRDRPTFTRPVLAALWRRMNEY